LLKANFQIAGVPKTNMSRLSGNTEQHSPILRIRFIYSIVVLVAAAFVIQLFNMQVVHYDDFKAAASNEQTKRYEIPATRGLIYAEQGGGIVPIVLNDKEYIIYADPVYIKEPNKVADSLAQVLGGQASDYLSHLKKTDSRYEIIEKRVSEQDKDQIMKLDYPGVGAQEQAVRTYPNGAMAAQLLGFVDASGQGRYGIEQSLNEKLAGTPGRVKAVTDVYGVPLAASQDNVSQAPKPGDSVVLTIDTAMQKQLESILTSGTKAGKAGSSSALILDANTGAVKAMANFPTYNPAKYYAAKTPTLFKNGTVDNAIEVGSIMKTLTTAAALDQNVIRPNTTFYDPGSWLINGFRVTDVEQSRGTQSIGSVLNLSLNTGAIWMLMQMGGGELNTKARDIWHDYMVNHYRLGSRTGIDQGYESSGFVPSPESNGAGIDLTYANTTFGQAMTATPLQMAAALGSVVNGGTYYKPRLISQIIEPNGRTENNSPKVEQRGVVSRKTSQGLISLMQYVITHHYDINPQFDQSKYVVGGKTGTAQVAKPNGGGYYADRYNATYMGFVGGAKPKYIIVVFVYNPDTSGYASGFAGSLVAQPIFVNLARMLINNGYVAPQD
jgi:cell division protein FtsI/penicillin-binding protein 2